MILTSEEKSWRQFEGKMLDKPVLSTIGKNRTGESLGKGFLRRQISNVTMLGGSGSLHQQGSDQYRNLSIVCKKYSGVCYSKQFQEEEIFRCQMPAVEFNLQKNLKWFDSNFSTKFSWNEKKRMFWNREFNSFIKYKSFHHKFFCSPVLWKVIIHHNLMKLEDSKPSTVLNDEKRFMRN